jgi:hypothetical protein
MVAGRSVSVVIKKGEILWCLFDSSFNMEEIIGGGIEYG